MGIFDRFPYTDFHRLNADWILRKVEEASEDAAEAAETVAGYNSRLTAVEGQTAGAVRFDEAQDLTSTQQGRARTNIGAAPADMAGAVRYDSSQTLTTTQQGQARANIGAAPENMFGAVRYDDVQILENAQKIRARSNIGAAAAADLSSTASDLSALALAAVRSDLKQSFTPTQQQQARQNIGAASADAIISGAVLYSTSQALSTSEKNQARANIGARSQDDTGFDLIEIHSSSVSGIMDVDVTVSDSASGPVLVLDGIDGQGSGNDVKVTGVAAPTAGNDAANKTYADSVRGMYLSTISGADVIIQPDAVGAVPNTLYICSAAELNSLEIVMGQSYAANREFTVRFTSGATPTELTTPLTLLGVDDLIPEANTIYEINVLGDLAVWHSWEVPSA